MKRTLTIMILLGMLLSAFTIPALAVEGPIEPLVPPPSAETGEMVNETPSLWFVELSSPPTADGGSLVFTKRDKANFRAAASRAGLEFSERYAFDTLWNGLSIKINPVDLAKLARIPGVAGLYPVVEMTLPEPAGSPSPELFTAIQMTGADIAQSELGYTGAGVKVAVMDTGIDYDHPDLGGCFGPGCRVAYGWDLVGDDFSAGVNDTRVPDPDPDDCAGHGTHVAGIVGANGTVVGVAPDVTFGAYRVFGCSGSTWADIMIEAMEMALADGMDILNMS
ncbi:MAG: S8 family serine peptidase, partial [Chloroflexota bacterium]